MTLAVRIHEFGDSSVLQTEELETPQPGPGELLVRVHAAGVNPVDFKIRQGKYPPIAEDALPMVMGRDISGVVETAGEAVDSFRQGAAIHAVLGRHGGYAQHAIVRADEAAAVPLGMSHVSTAEQKPANGRRKNHATRCNAVRDGGSGMSASARALSE